ncbi:MAG: HSP90 family protein [Solirubrobacterales bacterium]|nr:HSP90 family protein [Solirubrobacterales bacterium]
MEHAFQVDLRGVVDLLSHHLYASPRVYVRELLQNAVDAISARRLIEEFSPKVTIDTGDGTLAISDNGIGLTEPEVHELLATIGRSSKQDDLGFARREFLGQFGIGLLSCFMVADQVRVLTRSARGGSTVQWTGFGDGRYQVAPAPQRAEVGTTVSLVPRAGMENWLSQEAVANLAAWFGDLLPVPIEIGGRRINSGVLPWRRQYASPEERVRALSRYAEQTFGFTPLDAIDLYVPEAGLSGVAFVLPVAANPGASAGHRVYLRQMLLADSVESLLPDWAFFVHCVVDTSELRPTASREALYEDDLLADTQRALGTQIKDWMVELAATRPDRLEQFLSIHHLGVKAVATHDLEMLRIVDHWWPMETSAGPLTLAAFRRRFQNVRYTLTTDEFRELAGVASAQGIGVINGGYAYDVEIMQRLVLLDPTVTVSQLEPADLATRFELPDPITERCLAPLLEAGSAALEQMGADVLARGFDPPSVPALYLVNRAALQAEEMQDARASATGVWGDVLGAFDQSDEPDRPQLILNLRSPVVRRMSELTDPDLAALSVQSLYGQALLQGHHPLGPDHSALLNRAFIGLLDWAMPS